MNLDLFYFLNGFGGNSSGLDYVFVFLANGFGYVLLLGIVYFIFSHEDRKQGLKEAMIILGSAVTAWVIAHVIKYFFYVPRPFEGLSGVNLLFSHDADSSFPSGHATFYGGLAVAMYFYRKPLAVVLGLGAVLIGISRVISGVHFPIDILGGFILALIVCGSIGFYMSQKNDSVADMGKNL